MNGKQAKKNANTNPPETERVQYLLGFRIECGLANTNTILADDHAQNRARGHGRFLCLRRAAG
jgi:hypothetical protein